MTLLLRLFVLLAFFFASPADATITTSANSVTIAGTGSQTTFGFGFVGASTADISVIYTNASGGQTPVTQGPGSTQFQVTLNAAAPGQLWGIGGTVTYNPNGTPIANGTTLTITRTVPNEQTTNLQNQASFGQYAASTEQMGDLLEMQIQQAQNGVNRAIQTNPTNSQLPNPLPPAAEAADMGLCFDSSGYNVIACQAIPAGSVIIPLPNSELATMAPDTVKCNNTNAPTNPIDCTELILTAVPNIYSIVAPSATIVADPNFVYSPLGIGVVSTSDNVACTAGVCETGGFDIPSLLSVQQYFGGSNINTGRNAGNFLQQFTAATSASNPYRFYVALNAFTNILSGDNGTAIAPAGEFEGITSQVQTGSSATHLNATIGLEVNMAITTGSSVDKKAYMIMSPFPTDTVQGASVDTFIWTYGFTGSAGSDHWLYMNDQGGKFPLTTSADFIFVGAGSPATINNGINFDNTVITTNVLSWNNATWNLTGSGDANLNFGSFATGVNFGAANTFFTAGVTSTGSATPTLGTNKPGSNGSPTTWLKVTVGASTVGWIPVFGN